MYASVFIKILDDGLQILRKNGWIDMERATVNVGEFFSQKYFWQDECFLKISLPYLIVNLELENCNWYTTNRLSDRQFVGMLWK